MSRLPNLIVIGAMKCGTGSLHYYLGLHPEIKMSRPKELDFFIEERNWNETIDWYKSHFSGEARIYGESSPNYTRHPFFAGVPERMHKIVPGAKLIYILRDPFNRMISHYIHECSMGRESRTFSEALKERDDNLYVSASMYYMQLRQYLEYFPLSSILIVTLEELHLHRFPTLQKVFRFLNVDDSFHSQDFSNIRNESSYRRRKSPVGSILTRAVGKPVIEKLPIPLRRLLSIPFSRKVERPEFDEKLREELIEYFKDDINCLREVTGYKFEDWSL